jgi:hypothetical protein
MLARGAIGFGNLREATMGNTDDWFEANGSGVDHSFGALGSAVVGFGNTITAPPLPYELGAALAGSRYGVLGFAFTSDLALVPPDNYSINASVIGVSSEFTGVAGVSTFGPGVYGHKGLPDEDQSSIPNGLPAGVVGTSTNWHGVIGWSTIGNGVEGVTFNGEGGVVGVGDQAPGVSGVSFALSGVEGRSGDFGPTVPAIGNIAGVVGTSDEQPGVIGTSNFSPAVVGFSTRSYAGYFSGDVFVTGALTQHFQRSAVAFPGGTHRALYGMESPELWFEDFGAAKLKGGRAVVTLDEDFAKVIKRGYHVFLAPEGDCRGLYVRRKSVVSFEVREVMGGKSSIAFSYRIVGRRKDIKGHGRFAKIDMRLPLPALPPRKPASTAARLRAFVARVEKEARKRRPKGAKKGGRSHNLSEYLNLRARTASLPLRPPPGKPKAST